MSKVSMWCNGQAPLMLGGGNGSIPFMDFLSYAYYGGYSFIMYRLHPPAKRLFCAIPTVDLISW